VVTAGETHRRQRKVINPAFAGDHVKRLVSPFWAKGVELCRLLKREETRMKGKGGYNVVEALTRTTLDIIGLAGSTPLVSLSNVVAFGYDIGSLKDENNPIALAYFTIFDTSPETLFCVLLVALFPLFEKFPFLWIKKSQDAKVTLINHATEIIAAKMEGGLHTKAQLDILGCVLQENERLQSRGEEGLSNDEMISQILTFLAAGYVISTPSTPLSLLRLICVDMKQRRRPWCGHCMNYPNIPKSKPVFVPKSILSSVRNMTQIILQRMNKLKKCIT
jgi:cytochrome P450